MVQELTSEYNMDNYLTATRACDLITYSLEAYEGIPSTTYIRDLAQIERISSIRKKSHKDLNAGWIKLAQL